MERAAPVRLRYLGLLLLAGAWEFADGVLAPVHGPVAAGLILCGTICLLLPQARPPSRTDRKPVLAAVAAILLLQALFVPVAPLVATRFGSLSPLSPALAGVLQMLGAAATGADGIVRIERAGRMVALLLHADQFAPLLLLRFLLALGIMSRFGGTGGRVRAGRVAAAVALFVPLRIVALLLLAIENDAPYLFVEPAWTVLTHLPLVLFLPRPEAGPGPARPAAPKGNRWTVPAAALAGGAAAFALGFTDPGVPGGGHLLIDESHGRWEATDVPFDTSRYGRGSLYNYRCWRDWLARHYRVESAASFPDRERLNRFDVLILKTPTEPYRREEIERIRSFVAAGGGLLLIGDHTNLFGMGEVLNRVARPFGVEFRYDDTYPLRHGARDRFRPPSLLRHPAVPPVDRYAFETTCSLRVPLRAGHAIVGRRLGSDPVDYSHKNFFGNMKLDLDDDYGAFVQMASVVSGRGRVVAFCDSTNFSNFSFFWPGRRELALSMVAFLNRRNGPLRGLGAAGLLLAAAALGLAVRGAWRSSSPYRLAAAALALWAGAGAGAGAVSAWMESAYPPPAPVRPARLAWFDRTWSGGRIDPDSPILDRDGRGTGIDDFNTLFLSTARSGYLPAFGPTGAARLAATDLLVIVNPVRPFGADHLRLLDRFVRRGGTIVLLDSIRNRSTTAGPLLARFGIRLEASLAAGPAPPARDPRLEIRRRDLTARLFDSGPGRVAVVDRGRGRLIVAADSAIFSDAGMGALFGRPAGPEWEGHRLWEDLLRRARGEPPRRGAAEIRSGGEGEDG